MPDPFVNAFIGAEAPPTASALRDALGAAHGRWDALVDALERECGIDEREWHCYSKKAGWSVRARRAGRTIVYLAPARGTFRASFALGAKALAAARASGLPAAVLASMDAAKKVPEGTPVRVEVRTRADVQTVVKLAKAKALG